MLASHTTLVQFLINERREHPSASGDLNGLILSVALACKAISKRVAVGELAGAVGSAGGVNVQGEVQHKLDVVANDYFLRANEWGGQVAGMASEELDHPYLLPGEYPRGKYLLIFDPLDGSSNIDVNVSVGSIFSILRAAHPGADPSPEDFLQPGAEQVCAGYALYGPSTVLVLTVGTGVHAFTLDPGLGEFILTRESILIPPTAKEFAINASNRRFWEPAVRRYIDECLAGRSGPRGRDFNMRWVASLVAETHRILTRGGVFLYPRDTKDASKPGRLRLLYEASPVAFLIEQAGGAASTGRGRIRDVVPEHIHQRVPLIFGVKEEVERIESYHLESNDNPGDLPLYGRRGLFRATVG
ncbi:MULTISPECIES: class 1 fructose-bisphosphatase [Mycolicibacterium]|uniref:Fructose-1,6-bisphosphatase class 1 n=1 Tax=Mycolicibacterium holsaticum TaxID=152142 RepID=A0A1E3R5R6_9MYCO|nr:MULTISPECIES: class 1 fructose-bisphosphatase [Mycolicibacterium]OBA85463.1 fructose-bisphosphatase [Mycolicibacterium elephantis]ODQ85071.1 fructose-bisphosphatase [Mycolicibacterium holsaticum]